MDIKAYIEQRIAELNKTLEWEMEQGYQDGILAINAKIGELKTLLKVMEG